MADWRPLVQFHLSCSDGTASSCELVHIESGTVIAFSRMEISIKPGNVVVAQVTVPVSIDMSLPSLEVKLKGE